ncbi:MAG: DeoR/GlpR family DNA-binding transcription regulator [Paracoccaceae bacterium]
MLPALRRARIIELLRRDGAAGLKEMSEALGVSVSTLRRDVDYLCENGHIERTHGGAMLKEGRAHGVELDRDIASELNSDAKSQIGRHAAALIQPGQTVILDSGTTTAAAARAARDRGIRFTAVTNDFLVAAILSESPHIQVTVAGGSVRSGTSTLMGADTLQYMHRLRADLAFVGAHALTVDEMSDTSIELAELKRMIIAAADHPVLLADSSKIFSRAFCAFGAPAGLGRLITDAQVAPDRLAALRGKGTRVDVAGEQP